MSRGNNTVHVRPIITAEDGEKTKKDLISKHFEASKISLMRLDQADHVDRLLECIRDNDGPGADEFLGELTTAKRRELLSEPILSQGYQEKASKENFYRRMDYTWLSMIAAGAGSDRVFETIVRYGAPLDVSESDGSTIGHAVAHGAYFMPELEVAFVRIYFHFTAQIGNREKLRRCMLTEDRTGARPFELAAVLGKFEVFYAMMETEHLYKTIDVRQGTWNRATYDFVEYEKVAPHGRRDKSPLKIFTFLREKDLDSPGFQRVFGSPPIKAWMAQHVNTTRFALFIWCLIRTIFTGVYLSVLARVQGVPKLVPTVDEHNNTVNVSTCPSAFNIVLPGSLNDSFVGADIIFLSFCLASFVVFDICDGLYYVFHSRRLISFFERPENDDALIVHSLDHRILQVLFVLNVFITLVFRALESEAIIYSYVLSILVVSMTYMYFLQFMPGIGYLVIGLQRSMSMFGSFSAIFFLIFMSFSLAFYILNQVCCTQLTLARSIYQTFQIFLNQINVLTDFECESYRLQAWALFHILYVTLMVILLLNFCIAILSESAIRITRHKEILQDLQYLNASMVIEDRVGWAARRIREYGHGGLEMGVVRASVKLRQPFAMK